MPTNPLRNIPSVTELLETPRLKGLVDKVSHNVVVTNVRNYLDRLRTDWGNLATEMQLPSPTEVAEKIAQRILRDEKPSLRPVINATGILLHTGLGRAPLAEAAVEEMVSVARDYASVPKYMLQLGLGWIFPR